MTVDDKGSNIIVGYLSVSLCERCYYLACTSPVFSQLEAHMDLVLKTAGAKWLFSLPFIFRISPLLEGYSPGNKKFLGKLLKK